MTWSQAEAQIKAAGLVPVEHKEPSSTVQSGLVISTNPDNGNSVAKGSTVTVNVSTGVENITCPTSRAPRPPPRSSNSRTSASPTSTRCPMRSRRSPRAPSTT